MALPDVTVFTHLEPAEESVSWDDTTLDRSPGVAFPRVANRGSDGKRKPEVPGVVRSGATRSADDGGDDLRLRSEGATH